MTVTLDGTLSSSSILTLHAPPQPAQYVNLPVSYSWTTNCPEAIIDDPSSASPKLSFKALSSENIPTSCSVFLTVNNTYGQSASCSAGVTVDQCDVDCNGVLNGGAIVDECGVCDGDGTSCLGCTEESQIKVLVALDSQGLAQAKYVKAVANKLLRDKRASKKSRALASAAIIDSAKLYNNNWSTTWTLPKVIATCTNTQLCSTVDFSPLVADYVRNSDKLLNLLVKVVKEYQQVSKSRLSGLKELNAGIKVRKSIERDVKTVGKVSSVCTTTR